MRSQFFVMAAVATVATATLAITGPPAHPATAVAVRSTTGAAAPSQPFHVIQPHALPIRGVTPSPTTGPLLDSTATDNPPTPGAASGTPQPGTTATTSAPDRRHPHPTPTPKPTPTPTPRPAPPPPPGCTGPALTSQSQVRSNTSYCGGHATSRIVLADGDTWTNGDVSGVSTGQQQGAVQCGDPCRLVNMNIHDNPGAFAGIYMPGNGNAGPVTVTGGRVVNNGSLGIGGSGVDQLTISGVEIGNNGASANCGFEGGGFKGVNSGARITNNYVHDNNCMGIWFDINASNNEIDHNRVANNADGGIFYEISQNAIIHDNTVTGNGAAACGWLWGAGIGIASSFNIQVYGNTVSGNCNGIAGTQQDRNDSTPPDHLLANLSIHNNRIAGPGLTGAAADNGAHLATRNIVFANNTFSGGAHLCALTC